MVQFFQTIEQKLESVTKFIRDYIFFIVGREGSLRVNVKTGYYDKDTDTAMVVTFRILRLTDAPDIRVLVEYSDGDSGYVSINSLTIEQLYAIASEISKFE